MKALIAAGGHGTRLRPITFTLNKHLIPIANKPLIYYAIEKAAQAGIKEIGININPGDKELPRICGDGKKWGVKITYIEQKGGALGVAHVVKMAEKFIDGDSFVFYLGDNIVLANIKSLVDEFKKKKMNCMLALSKVNDPQRFGVPVINESGEITRVEEKPQNPKSNFAVTGIYIYDNSFFKAYNKIKPSDRGEYEISDVHTKLIESGYKVGYKEITGWWKDTGKPQDLLEGNQLILENIKRDIKGKVHNGSRIQGRVIIGEGSEIIGKSFVRGPVVIGKNCRIKDSYIGPFSSVGNEVETYGAEIEHSIVFDYADVKTSKRIVDSLIGLNADVLDDGGTMPSGHKLIVGENSSVEL